MLGAIPFIDGATYSFDEFYRRSFTQIAKASGRHIVFQRTGNPRFSDPLYREMRTPEQAEEDDRHREQWEREFPTSEAEEYQRINECVEWLAEYDLKPEDLPCFVFVSDVGHRVGLLRIPERWYDSETSWKAFLWCFCSWLEQEDLVELATGRLGCVETTERLSLMMQKLGQNVDRQLRSVDLKAIRTRKPIVPFPTPAGASWRDVEIKFRDGHTVSIKVKEVRQICSYSRMGMDDKRSSNPTVQWRLLQAFADGHGILDWTSSGASRKNQKRREQLSSNLQDFFRIDGDPFRLTDDRKGWKARFLISPSDSLSSSQRDFAERLRRKSKK